MESAKAKIDLHWSIPAKVIIVDEYKFVVSFGAGATVELDIPYNYTHVLSPGEIIYFKLDTFENARKKQANAQP